MSLKTRPWRFSISGSKSSLRPACQAVERALLVALHESRVADDIGGEDRRELAFQGGPPSGEATVSDTYTTVSGNAGNV